MTNPMTKTAEILPSVCPLDCPDTCSLSVEVMDGKINKVRGSRANPYTAGVICKKVSQSYPDFVHGADRLQYPLKKTDTGFARISWDEALDLVHGGFQREIDKYGAEAVMPLNYAGPHGELAEGSMDRRFFNRLGATELDRGPLCGGVRGAAYASLYGNAPGMPPTQAVHSDLIMVWGNNVTVSNLHFTRVINQAKRNGARVVVIDPRRTKVAAQADLFVPLTPGTDVILGLALAAEIDKRGKLDTEFISAWVEGAETYLSAAHRYSVSDVVDTCGISEEQFLTLVDWIIEAKAMSTCLGVGIERSRSGGAGLRTAMALNALTGHHGRLGAGIVAKSGLHATKTSDRLQASHLRQSPPRVFNIVDVAEKLLDSQMETPVKAIMIYNHNPVATHPDQARMIQALSQDDVFVVGCDVVMTDSMALCDVVLPACSHFEHDDLFGAYGQNFVQRSAPVIPRVGESLPNTEIFRRLAARFGFEEPEFKESDAELMDSAMTGLGVQPSQLPLDRALEMGGAEGADAILCDSVHPTTPSGKIELFSKDLESKFDAGLPRYIAVRSQYPLILITPSSDKRINATFGGCAESDQAEVLDIHPDDAKARGLVHGQRVILWNDQAEVALQINVNETVRPGVVSSPKGTWRRSSSTGLTVNALISRDSRCDLIRGAAYNDTFVDVRGA